MTARKTRKATSAAARAKISRASKKRWRDPKMRKRMTDNVAKVNRTPKARKRVSEANKARWAAMTPRQRKAFVEKVAAAGRKPKARAAARERMKARWASPAQRAKMTAAIRRGVRRRLKA